jgi:hypothetical protein
MQNELISFDDLVLCRQQLQKFCGAHFDSLAKFFDSPCFKLSLEDDPLKGAIRHLSSTSTCFESLLDCPEVLRPAKAFNALAAASEFASRSMERPRDDWKSDGSADIYCRCRALPLIVKHLPGFDQRLESHLQIILSQLDGQIGRMAIGEAMGERQEDWYPPNAFHTYWTLKLLNDIEQRFSDEFKEIEKNFAATRSNISRVRAELILWSRQTCGYQIALHSGNSSALDSDQLAWSLTALIAFDSSFPANLAQRDFLKHALACLFRQQTDSGVWRTGAPLFHYRSSGNAYCYVFETFATLLRAALTEKNIGSFARAELRPYAGKLLNLWQYARSTEISLGDGNSIGWNSSHRPNRNSPESWATASVFAYSQCLRRLIGIWTRESAATQRGVAVSTGSPEDGIETLKSRGDTWTDGGESVAAQLLTLFVNPVHCVGMGDKLEPDSQLIEENQARAAILFGPPGTSKTTLAKGVAQAIGWDYVEIHASHFVADGLPNVQKTADAIFEQLMQLDRTVILFDEIDELVRAREKEPDAFGRFLTTSMLPKLAELWKRRKVMYFIATNHVRFFDPAVIRAQRFDALVHVAPPSFDRKIRRIKELLQMYDIQTLGVEFNAQNVQQSLKDAGGGTEKDDNESLASTARLAKFLLIRWDQIDELVSSLRTRAKDDKITLQRDSMEECLGGLLDPSLKTRGTFRDYIASSGFEQHDFGKTLLYRVFGDVPAKFHGHLRLGNDECNYVARTSLDLISSQHGNYSCKVDAIHFDVAATQATHLIAEVETESTASQKPPE